jgi:hypothetical protein
MGLVQQISCPSLEVFVDKVERRCFAFFRARTVNEISGYFPSDFWERLVPRVTYYEPCLKHAVIALASLHERFEKGDREILKSNKDVAEGGVGYPSGASFFPSRAVREFSDMSSDHSFEGDA